MRAGLERQGSTERWDARGVVVVSVDWKGVVFPGVLDEIGWRDGRGKGAA